MAPHSLSWAKPGQMASSYEQPPELTRVCYWAIVIFQMNDDVERLGSSEGMLSSTRHVIGAQ